MITEWQAELNWRDDAVSNTISAATEKQLITAIVRAYNAAAKRLGHKKIKAKSVAEIAQSMHDNAMGALSYSYRKKVTK